MVFYGSGNRDEEVFADPDRFDVGRDPNPHMAFGGGGPHLCLGLHVARIEIAAMLRELLTRLPDLAPAGAPRAAGVELHQPACARCRCGSRRELAPADPGDAVRSGPDPKRTRLFGPDPERTGPATERTGIGLVTAATQLEFAEPFGQSNRFDGAATVAPPRASDRADARSLGDRS